MPKVRWVVQCGFCSKFHALSNSEKIENRLRFDEVTESLKVGTFFETQCTNVISIHTRSSNNLSALEVYLCTRNCAT